MELTFYPADTGFQKNLQALRRATIDSKPSAPAYMVVMVDGNVDGAKTAHVRADGWLAYYHTALGEIRVKPDRVSWVKAVYTDY